MILFVEKMSVSEPIDRLPGCALRAVFGLTQMVRSCSHARPVSAQRGRFVRGQNSHLSGTR
jgi:hypothetical protein